MQVVSTIRLINKWWRTWGTLPVRHWVRAAALYKQGDFERASKCYEKGLKRFSAHPASFCARMDLSYCFFRLQRFEEAEIQLRQVIVKLPHSREAHIRLAKLYLWTGRTLDAVWTMKRALKGCGNHNDLVSWFLYTVSENGGPAYLIREALKLISESETGTELSPLAQAAKARLLSTRGRQGSKTQEGLERIASQEDAEVEVLLIAAETLLRQHEVASARRYLRRALAISADHPRILSLLAESYLQAGPFYNSSYANQLAIQACQSNKWLSPREMHVLAETYFHLDDRISALIIAQKAKAEGSRLLGSYPEAAVLDRLIEHLSSEPVAS
ncbi:MAG: tetratricopeptide repeat protein [Bdellovibrionales bacterium]|nr:tetratricopeptide repeat protein [Bdellovibrionales bacterium]